MADLAHLRISVDSREVRGADRDLRGLTQAASRSTGIVQRFGLAAAAAFASIGFAQLARDVFQANVEFQRLNAALSVATGSTASAKVAFKQIQDFASTTPYQLNQSVEAFIKLKNLGLDPSMKALRSYGNTASSMGKDLMQMIEAVADATTGEFERLKEFGIKAKQEGDKVSLTFRGTTTTIGKSAAEIEKYLQDIGNNEFAGAMEAQMATLGGRVSNLQDAIYNLYIQFSQSGAAETLGRAITALANGIKWLADNIDNVIGYIKAATAAFIAYKAVMIASLIPTTAFGSLILTIGARLGAGTAALAVFNAGVAYATTLVRAWTVALLANPIFWIASAIAGVTAMIVKYNDQQEEAIQHTRNLSQNLKDEAAARSENYKAMRAELFLQQLQLQTKITDLRIEKERNAELNKRAIAQTSPDEKKFTRIGAGVRNASASAELSLLTAQVNEIKKGIAEADAAWSAAAPSIAQSISTVAASGEQAEDKFADLKALLAQTREEITRMSETPLDTKLRELEEAAKKAANNGLAPLAASLREVAKELLVATEWQRLGENLENDIKQRQDAEKQIKQYSKELEHEISLLGMSNSEREIAILNFEEEAIVAEYAAKGIDRNNEALREYLKLKRQLASSKSAMAKEAAETQRLANNLETAAAMLGNGRLGSVLQNALKLEIRMKDGESKKISDALAETFPKLSKALGDAMAGAQMGEQIGGFMKALGIKTSKTGAQIGGAFGQMFGGPLGAIAGSIAGGLIGGMMKSTPRASATIQTVAGDAMMSSVKGNKGQLKQMAEGLAGSVISGLQKIADEFSGTITDGFKVSIGVRNKTFRVDPLGLGRTKGMIAFDTEEEAIRYAIKLALDRGVIAGIRESTKKLLQAGDSLDAALQDALDFEGVFDRLLEKTDPLAFSLKELEKEFDRLNKLFEKAGATTEEFAELQRLYDLERADILKEEQQRQVDEANKINDLIKRIYREQGKEAEELALTRRMESEAASEAERAILAQIYALEDFNKVRLKEVETLEDTIATMSQLAASLRQFRASLFGAEDSVANYRQALVDLIRVGSLASTGDAGALGRLQGVSQTFLAASKARAGSLFEYQKDVALVASYVDQGIAAADEQVSAAEQQIDLLQRQLDELVNISELLTQQTVPDLSLAPDWNANIANGGSGGAGGENMGNMEAMLRDALYNIAKNTGNTARLLDRWDGDGQPDIREYAGDYY